MDMESDDSSEKPAKRSKTYGSQSTVCIICCLECIHTDAVKPRDFESWTALLNAAKIRQHEPLLSYKDCRTTPDIAYHTQCRSSFVHKRELSKEQKFQPNTETITLPTTRNSNNYAKCTSLENVCIFCDKTSKYQKGSNSRESLRTCIDLRSDATVREIAIEKMDKKLLAVTSQELVATQANYHRSCYRSYTRKRESNESKYEDDAYANAEADSFSVLFEFIRTDLFQNPRLISMVEIFDRFVAHMKTHGIQDVKYHCKSHVRRKLENEFGSDIEFVNSFSGSRLYALPCHLSREKLIKENIRLLSELDSLKSECSGVNLPKCAKELRRDIRSIEAHQEWPPQPAELTEANLCIPSSLSTFFEALLAGDVDSGQASTRVKGLVQSFAQDCMYAVSNCRLKPPKQILLPMAVKSLTGNVELITILNRLGHGISYSALLEIDTALCLQKLAETDTSCIALPDNILPCVPTTLAFDNIDRMEETLSGEGTSHRVNGIVIQPQVPTVPVLSTPSNAQKTKRRSISPPVPTVEPYIANRNRIGPQPRVQTVQDVNNNTDTVSQTKDAVWCVLRQLDTNNQTISSWTGFNIETRNKVEVTPDKVEYLATINAPATDMSTVHEILQQCLKIRGQLQLNDIVCVFDQALYAKAMEIKWKNTDMYRSVVIRMGVFHTLCNVLGIIGKRFRDAGLRDLAIEASVVAEGSIDAVLEGRRYNRAIRLHKLMYEAMMRLMWKGFVLWITESHPEHKQALERCNNMINIMHSNVNQDQMEVVLDNPACIQTFQLFDVYKETLRSSHGDLAQFWMSYINMIEVLLGLLRATREGDWLRHLSMIRQIIPWCFAYDRQNYARYMSVYYLDMVNLASTHPETYSYFIDGGFAVQRSSANTFGKIPVDQTIEETINKDTQTAGGTKGFSLKPGAVSKYYLTAECRSTCLRNLRQMTCLTDYEFSHPDMGKERIKKDEMAVQAIQEILETRWVNPFGANTPLVSLSRATTVSTSIRHDLLSAIDIGEDAYKAFTETRLERDPPSASFYDRLPRQQLKTFKDTQKAKKTTISGKEYILKADHNLFGHMVLVASSRNLDMKQVLKHPLGPLPWTLANSDGTLRKTPKAPLAKHLESRATLEGTHPVRSASIIDAMSIVNKANAEKLTYGELAELIFSAALRTGNSERIDIVFDVYRTVSIKNAERSKRGAGSSINISNISSGQKIHQWRGLLGSCESKTALINFLVETWKGVSYRGRLGDKVVYVASGEKCYRLRRDDVDEVEELYSCQEEADTRLLLHAKHASDTYPSIVIVSEDTDVMILCLAFYRQIGHILIRCGTRNRLRYIDVNNIGDLLGVDACLALLAFHAFTGCDSVSAFSGRGKVAATRLVTKPGIPQSAMLQLGWNGLCPQNCSHVFKNLHAGCTPRTHQKQT